MVRVFFKCSLAETVLTPMPVIREASFWSKPSCNRLSLMISERARKKAGEGREFTPFGWALLGRGSARKCKLTAGSAEDPAAAATRRRAAVVGQTWRCK